MSQSIEISNTDENADWIKALSDDVEVSEAAKALLEKDEKE